MMENHSDDELLTEAEQEAQYLASVEPPVRDEAEVQRLLGLLRGNTIGRRTVRVLPAHSK